MSKSPKKLLEAANDPNSVDSLLRRLRDLELSNSQLSRQVTAERKRREQAEHDRMHAEEQFEAVLTTQDKFTGKKLASLKKKPGGKSTAVICMNDWHTEERIDPLTIDHANEFNLDIALKRIETSFQKSLRLLEFARHLTVIDELVVWFGGDLINGVIHEELEEGNFLGPSEAVLYVQDRMNDGLQLLKREANVSRIICPTSMGNHGRSTKRTRISTGYRHSWEYLAYGNMERLYSSDPQVIFKNERGYHNWLPIQGHDCRFHHGDSVKFNGGVGGVTVPLKKKLAMWDKRKKAAVDFVAHFHQRLFEPRIVLCGCLVGYNAYAQHIGAEFEEPNQTFAVIDRDYGKVLTMPIFCEAK